MEPAVAYNQPDFDYRRAEGVNQSSLKKILDSPAHYKASLTHRWLPTPAMEMGTALHCLVLDGQEAFDSQYILKPDNVKLNTKEGKDWKDKVGRKKVLTTGGRDDPWNSVLGMGDSLKDLEWFDPAQPDYIKHNEVSFYWEWLGVPCKARLDRVLIDEGIVVDLKTTDSVDPMTFTKKVVGLGYDFQAAYYAKAAEVAYGKPFKFVFAAVERRAPYSVGLFDTSEEMLEEGMRKCEAALKLYKQCEATHHWPGPTVTMRKLEYPSWYTPYKIEEDPHEDLF